MVTAKINITDMMTKVAIKNHKFTSFWGIFPVENNIVDLR